MSSPESAGSGVPGTYVQRTTKHASEAHEDEGKLIVVMVGLPARGKSYIVKKLRRYLNWLGFATKVFNVGNRRRTMTTESFGHNAHEPNHNSKFFDPDNTQARALRDQLAMDSLEELIRWLRFGQGHVAIHDATNSTRARRRLLLDRCQKEPNCSLLFVESICDDDRVVRHNIQMKLMSPDYQHMEPADARRDFLARLQNYERAYQTLGSWEERHDVQYCKIINVGKKVIAYNIQGYLAGQCVFYLMNMNLARRQIWISRHGESTDNLTGCIGGDAPLSAKGQVYAAALATFINEQRVRFEASLSSAFPSPDRTHSPDGTPQGDSGSPKHALDRVNESLLRHANSPSRSTLELPNLSRSSSQLQRHPPAPKFVVWTSMLRRAIGTVDAFDPLAYDIKHIRALNEIYAGSCEGMTYQEIQETFPREYADRQANKLYYRYPGMGGESYADVIQRLHPLIVELERTTHSALIVTHNAMSRTLLSYMLDIPTQEMTRLEVPLHTVYCIEPKPFGNECRKYAFDFESNQFYPVD
ncbi:Fructose-2,6-bisphosphatase [Dimargaris verticillata]|uniref:Fructose-2,6-bisphosphatase n=1 Tax=Dimargaris verticillata TaxID=2761393 RepID=A0A9W8EFK8_9FUNG|nr:Fructose-2,6-bisphosphatase [Dimargaris verticillata]